VCAISTVPFCTASTTPGVGTSSPDACVEIWNLPPVIALTCFANTSEMPYSVSSAFGKPDVRRQRTAGDWPMTAGAPRIAALAPAPTAAFFRNERLSTTPPIVRIE
jgi:hypothetical protein